MKLCQHCGAQSADTAEFCEGCGKSLHSQEPPQYAAPLQKSKKKITLVSIITTIIFVIIGRFAGTMLVDGFIKIGENREANKIDSFIERTNAYVPGYFNDEKYVSTHFDIAFEPDSNWTMYSKEDLAPFSDNFRQSTTSGAMSSLKTEDLSEELIQKYQESIYAEAEMGAYYVSDDMVVGEACVMAYSAYGIDDVSYDTFTEGIKEGLLSTANVTDSGEDYIADDKYTFFKATSTIDGMDMVTYIFIREKDSMVCMITCKSLAEYEEETLESFKQQLSKYYE